MGLDVFLGKVTLTGGAEALAAAGLLKMPPPRLEVFVLREGTAVTALSWRGAEAARAIRPLSFPRFARFFAAVSRTDSDLWLVQTEAFCATWEVFLEYSLTCFAVKPQALVNTVGREGLDKFSLIVTQNSWRTHSTKQLAQLFQVAAGP